jgi:hypothetical protein
MFLKNKNGELVNIKNVVAVRPFIDNYCPPTIHMYTKGGHKVRFCHTSESDAIQAHKAIKELLIRGPNHNQQPWIHIGSKWIDVDGNMFMIDQIECILVEGWVVTVHMENTMIEFFNHNDKELEQCLKNFEIALRGIGHIIKLDGWKAGG